MPYLSQLGVQANALQDMSEHRDSCDIAPNGAWLCKTIESHFFDHRLANAIVESLKSKNLQTVFDLGCGAGTYTEYLIRCGFIAKGFDANPNTRSFSEYCEVRDLTEPFGPAKVDCVLCLETGEHIPQEFEQQFIDNITNCHPDLLILSWFPTSGPGHGHVNTRPNQYVVDQFRNRGFDYLHSETEQLRESASLWWFKESLLVFRSRG